jgi:hypothetical protein
MLDAFIQLADKPNFQFDLFIVSSLLCEIFISFLSSFCLLTANALRVKRQDDKSDKKSEESFEQELCKEKEAGEWFRLVANEGDSCRDVIQCTTSVSCLVWEALDEFEALKLE